MISLDCETNGVDVFHGARPFLVTICDEDGSQKFWEWSVDPLTRAVEMPDEDVEEIRLAVLNADLIVGQNIKFDVSMLREAGVVVDWPWDRTRDTLIAGHLLASNVPHNLTDMTLQYLGLDILPYEERLKVACNEARRLARKRFPGWRIAAEGLPEMPSAKGGSRKDRKGVESESPWKFDCWLPRAVAQALDHPAGHPWWTACSEYANVDSAVTLPLWKVMEVELRAKDLWDIYLERMRLVPIASDMERRGVTISKVRLDQLRDGYARESTEAGRACVDIAAGYGVVLEMPKGASPNGSLRTLMLDAMKLPPVYNVKSKTAEPTLDKTAFDHWEATLPQGSKELTFVRTLRAKRKRDTAITYMTSYERFWRRLNHSSDWFLLHPNLNMTGTDTLRWSSSNPNEANISKQEGFNLRRCFGPAPGREWWSLDGKNLELRIPTYEAGETDLITVFDRPDDPPYFGSYHLVIFDLLHPEMFKEHGKRCKDLFESTWYQWVKNGNFASIYGAQEETADRAYHVRGAFEKIRHRFPRIAKLADRQIALASKLGWVETIPDRTVNPRRGYPLMCSRSEWGKVSPTVPLNYHIQGTAMQWTNKAMIRCDGQLREWSAKSKREHRMTMQIHDEIVFDLPAGIGPEPWRTNLPRVRVLQALMEKGGEDIGVPTPVSVEWNPVSWDQGVTL